jgi:hypothetical protein
VLPAQQAWPGPPQAAHWPPPLQTLPAAVQKSGAPPAPPQHCCPMPPQLPQLPVLHVPRLLPHIVACERHVVPLQHAPTPEPGQLELSQQGCEGPPHATNAPALHTTPPSLAPEGRQMPEGSRQPPPLHCVPLHGGWYASPHVLHAPFMQAWPVTLHMLFGQHAWPLPPHVAHMPVVRHRSPAPQCWPAAMHSPVPIASQQPAVQLLPAQQG